MGMVFVSTVKTGSWTVWLKQVCGVLTAMLISVPALALNSGEPAPELQLPVLGSDQQRSLADYRGKVVYLDFWASWCGPCRKSMPFMEILHQELQPQGLEIVAVNLDDEQAPALDFIKRYGVTYTNLFDGSSSSMDTFGVIGMPTALLIDRDGVVNWVHVGFSSEDEAEIRQRIEALLFE